MIAVVMHDGFGGETGVDTHVAARSSDTHLSSSAVSPSSYDADAAAFRAAANHEKIYILAPAILEAFKKAASAGLYSAGKDRVLDYGCGPFQIGSNLIANGHIVDGFDPTKGMTEEALKTIRGMQPNGKIPANEIRLFHSANEIPEAAYKLAILSFVHPCINTRPALKSLFKDVASKLESNGTLFVIGANPNHLTAVHSACKYDIEEPMKDGKKYTGIMYDAQGKPCFNLNGDTFWSYKALNQAADCAGMDLSEVTGIADVGSWARPASGVDSYFMAKYTKR